MRRKLVWGSVFVGVVVLVSGLLAVAMVRDNIQEEAQEELFRQAQVTGRRIEAELGAIELQPTGSLAPQLRGLSNEIRRVLDNAREIGGHDIVEAAIKVGERDPVPLTPDPRLLTQIPSSVTERDVVSIDVAGTPMLATVQRIDLDRPSVQLYIAIGRTEPLLAVEVMTRSLLAALAVGAILLTGLGAWFARSITARLRRLEQASRAVADGDLSARAPVDGRDEVTEVSLAFNQMAEQLESARIRERDFLMSVGHDLRTPLTTIRGYAEALDGDEVDPADMERVAGVLHHQTDRLSRLVEDFMLLARLEAREFTLRPERVDVAAHVKEIVGGHMARADAAYVRLEVDIDDNLGLVTIDPDRVGQICGNLLDNALRYTPESGIVTVRLSTDNGAVRLEVADSGPGIAEEDLDRVFDRLFVTQRYRPVRPEGSGLGLAIVRELVDAMGGTIRVHSEIGKGTSFIAVLPAPGAA